MKITLGSFLILSILFCAVTTRPASADPSIAFEKLKALVGSWDGTAKWTGGRTSEGKMSAVYALTGNGTAVVENLIVEGKPIMTSVYHMDGDSIRMTHYCGVGNQPRLKALPDPNDAAKITFEFVDITNLASPDAPHVTGAALNFQNENEITLSFEFVSKGVKSNELIQLHRVSPKEAPTKG
jgi:hypothetical protein